MRPLKPALSEQWYFPAVRVKRAAVISTECEVVEVHRQLLGNT